MLFSFHCTAVFLSVKLIPGSGFISCPPSFDNDIVLIWLICYASVCNVHLSVPLSWISQEGLEGISQIWLKSSTGLKDELNRFWWPRLKGKGHCELLENVFGHDKKSSYANSDKIHLIPFIKSLQRVWKDIDGNCNSTGWRRHTTMRW